MTAHHDCRLCLMVLMLAVPACDSRSPTSGVTGPGVEPSPSTTSLSGQVFEIGPSARSPAAGVTVIAAVLTTSSCGVTCTRITATYHNTTTGPDGRYAFPQLPLGSVAVLTDASIYHQVCGAGAELGPETRLDVEITSRTNPQPSPTMPGLRVTGQIYEMTPAGRVGLPGWSIGIDHHVPDSPFLTVYADANGHYTACGIPASWRLHFDVGNAVYEAVSGAGWHQFSGDTTVDIEMKRVQ